MGPSMPGKNQMFRHLMGMKLEEAMDFFTKTLRRLGFVVEVSEASERVIRAQKGDVTVTVRFKALQNAFIRIPRTDVVIEAPEFVHDDIRQHIMRSKAGG